MENIMEHVVEFVKPELLVLVAVLYFIGMMLKRSETFASKYIPAVLGLFGIALACLWVLGTETLDNGQDILLAAFTAIVQGIICAGLAVYCNQIIKQANTDDEAVLIMEEVEAEELTDDQLRAVLCQLGQTPAETATREDMLGILDCLAAAIESNALTIDE